MSAVLIPEQEGNGVDERLPVVYSPDAVLTIEQLAQALQVSVRTIERMDLPTIYCAKGKLRRYVYGQILETLKERAT